MTRTHASYRYLCAPSNPIATELFGDDLPRVVKDITLITDTNRITSKLRRDKKNSQKRGWQYERHDKFQRQRSYSGTKKLQSPLPIQGEGEEKSPEVSVLTYKSTQHPNSKVSAITQSPSKLLAGSIFFV